jgi:acyl-CoA thioesterase-1
MRRFFRIASVLFSLALAACGRGAPALSPLAPDAVVLAFGDSITFGVGAEEGESYPERLEALIGRRVINAGVPGEVTGQGLARLSGVLEEDQPALLILCLGGNDMLRRMDDDQTARNLRAMVTIAKARGVDVLLLGVPKPGLLMSSADFYEEIAEEFNLPYEGEALTEVLSDGSLKSDPIHPNGQGYERLAQAIAALLEKAEAI